MKTAMLGFLAETPVHPGTGRGMGVVDLPVAREAATDYPVLVGSSLKGALRDKKRRQDNDEGPAERFFGKPNHAGDLLVSDGRLLLLPVRSLTSQYRWVTCLHLIERYQRDLARAGLTARLSLPDVECGKVLTKADDNLFLEERQFSVAGKPPQDLVQALGPLMLHDETRKRLPEQLAVLHDSDFAWFARYGLAVQARNVLEDGTKKSKNLWYEETLPPDTVMYALIASRDGEPGHEMASLFPDSDPYLQVGGNETVGQGWLAVKVRAPGDGEAQ